MGLSAVYGPVEYISRSICSQTHNSVHTDTHFPSNDEERLAVLDRAWELGYTNWDTANAYGDSEVLIGKWFKLHPERRADIFLATKFGLRAGVNDKGEWKMWADNSPEFFNECLEGSLQKMGVDYVDLYYAHRLDTKVPVEKTMELMAKAKQ